MRLFQLLFCLPVLFFLTQITTLAQTQTNVVIRVIASNLSSGSSQRYETAGLDILAGLKPDIVAMQEFNVSNSFGINTTDALSNMVATTFGTNFVYFRESGSYAIPNGIISRYPIIASGSWVDSDTGVNDRGFAWAQVNLPGTNDLYVVSVHLKASSGAANVDRRTAEANELTSLIQTNFPTNAWIIVAGDMNLYSDTEGSITTFKTYLSDSPVPADQSGDQDTNASRNERYDRVLPSFSLTNTLTSVVLPSHTFSSGLVFDSRVYTPLSDVPPVASGDSGVTGMQHMGVVKDFNITYTITNGSTAPTITTQPQNQTMTQGSNAMFTVTAAGTVPLSYQWRFTGTNIGGATLSSYTRTNAQSADAGSYLVVVTNSGGSVTSSVATLTVNIPPSIATPPQNQTVNPGSNVSFTVTASGTTPFSYQWRFTGTNIGGATTSSYTRTNAQSADAGSYTVVVTNVSGSITSAAAVLSVNIPPSIAAQPQNQSVTIGSNVTFTVAATGTLPLSYQWRFAATNVSDATTSSYTRVNTQTNDAGDYSVVITNVAGSVTSSNATLTVNVPPSITSQPQSQSVNQAASVTFSVVAAGTLPLSYQWQLAGTNIVGATATNYTRVNVQPADIGNYSVLITNVAGAVASSNATLSLNVPPPLLTFAAPNIISWPGLSNLTYTVQAKTNLNSTDWTILGAASSPTVNISFTNFDDGARQRYYRVIYP